MLDSSAYLSMSIPLTVPNMLQAPVMIYALSGGCALRLGYTTPYLRKDTGAFSTINDLVGMNGLPQMRVMEPYPGFRVTSWTV